MNVRPQHMAAGLALLILVPVAVYLLSEAKIVALSLVCVLLVAGSLYYMFSPAEGGGAAH